MNDEQRRLVEPSSKGGHGQEDAVEPDPRRHQEETTAETNSQNEEDADADVNEDHGWMITTYLHEIDALRWNEETVEAAAVPTTSPTLLPVLATTLRKTTISSTVTAASPIPLPSLDKDDEDQDSRIRPEEAPEREESTVERRGTKKRWSREHRKIHQAKKAAARAAALAATRPHESEQQQQQQQRRPIREEDTVAVDAGEESTSASTRPRPSGNTGTDSAAVLAVTILSTTSTSTTSPSVTPRRSPTTRTPPQRQRRWTQQQRQQTHADKQAIGAAVTHAEAIRAIAAAAAKQDADKQQQRLQEATTRMTTTTTSQDRSESSSNSKSSRSSSSSEEDKEEERSVATHTPLHRSKPLHRPASTYANKKKKGLPLKNRYPHHHQQFWPPLNPAPSSPPALAPYPHQPSGRRDNGSSASSTAAPGNDRSCRNYGPTTFGGSSRRRHAYTLQYTHTRAPRPKQETTFRGGGITVQPPRHQHVIDGVDGRRW